MSTNRFLILACAAAFTVGWMALAAHFDQERAEGDTRHEKFTRAAQAACGLNASWDVLGDGWVQCRTHRGMKTHTAQVQP